MKRWFDFSFLIFAAGVTAGTFSAAIAADKLENIPLEFTPTSPLSERNPVDLKGVHRVMLRALPAVPGHACRRCRLR